MTLQLINEAIWYNRIVEFDGNQYMVTAVIKRKHKSKPEWYYQAELQDLHANSVTIADIEKVKEVTT